MSTTRDFPYLATANLKYKSPHKQDLSFGKGEKIRVISLAPKAEEEEEEDDEDDEWFIGESLDGSRKGTFPGGFVTISDQEEPQLGGETQTSNTNQDAAAASPISSEVVRDAEKETKVEVAEKEESKNKVDGASAPPTTSAADSLSEEVTSPPITEEKTGFGAPLPARPQSDDEEELAGEQTERKEQEKEESIPETSPVQVEKEKPSLSRTTPSTTASASVSTPSAPPSRSTAISPLPQTSSKPIAPSKPNSLKDRIAAFNKPAESGGGPPPLPKSKPGGWKRPPPAPGAAKPLLPGAKPVTSPPPTLAPSTVNPAPLSPPEPTNISSEESPKEGGISSSGSGFSAADAKSSIKMSLKERMAALQRGDPASAEDSGEPRSPPTAPGKIAQEKRDVAMAGMGLGADEAGLTRKPSNASAEGGLDEPSKPLAGLETSETADPTLSTSSSAPEESSELDDKTSERLGEADSQENEDAQEQPELTEEEQESSRRAAIAERLAKLGGRRMGGGPLFGGPPPIKPKPKASIDTVASAESSTSIDSPAVFSPSDEQSPGGIGSGEEAVKSQTLAVPRRAAPPRRKKSSATPPVQPAESVPSLPEPSSVEGEATGTEEPAPVATLPEKESAGTEESPAEEPSAIKATIPAIPAPESSRLAESEEEVQDDDLPSIAESSTLIEEPEETSPAQEEEVEPVQEKEPEEVPAAIPPRPTSIPPRPPSTGNQPPSRPGSVRPPIPKSTLPPPPTDTNDEEEEEEERELQQEQHSSISEAVPSTITSPVSPPPRRELPTPTPPVGRPPIPKSPPPLSPEEDEANTTAGHGRQPSFGAASIAAGGVTPLAAPRPRHAVPTDDFEEDAEDVPTNSTSESASQEPEPSAADPIEGREEAGIDQIEQEQEEEPELTEEEQETQRRAAITKRMAALSRGQMMPGMPGMGAFGAPMPIKKKSAPIPAEEAQESSSSQVEPVESSRTISSPPPPKSPPPSLPTESLNKRASMQSISSISSPPPLPPGRRSTQISEDNRASAAEIGESESLSRRASFRPPIPKSREPSTISNLGNAQEIDEQEEDGAGVAGNEEDDDAYASAIANQYTPSEETYPQSPPALPASPPPRAPPSASSTSQALPRTSIDRSLPPTPPVTQQPSISTSDAQPFSSTSTSDSIPNPPPSSSTFSQKSNTSRDLDLMPSSQWWRKGLNPLRLPPSIGGRPDAIIYVDQASQTKRGRTKHTSEIHVLFEDFSQTVVELTFEDDDAEESNTVLSQRHYFPPPKPTNDQLLKWSNSIGSAIAKAASASTGKQSSMMGDGTPRSFISTLVSQVKIALPPINQTYGATVLVQVGPTIMEKSSDEIRIGDIVACFNTDFKGKKGLTPYHLVLGSSLEPTLAVVVEIESKKNKLKCVLQSNGNVDGKSSNKVVGPEEVSLRLDDLKSGVLKVFRAVPNQGYLEDW